MSSAGSNRYVSVTIEGEVFRVRRAARAEIKKIVKVAGGGGFRSSSNTNDIVRLKFVDRVGMASQMTPAPSLNFTIIGVNDAGAQRAIGTMIKKYDRRGG